jgi:hypothetical protein
MLKIEGNFPRLRARSAHFVGHLPPIVARRSGSAISVAGLDSAWRHASCELFLSLFQLFHIGFDKSCWWRFQFLQFLDTCQGNTQQFLSLP